MARAAAASPLALLVLAGGALLLVLWLKGRGRAGEGASVAAEIGAAAGGAIVEAGAGVIVGIGGAVGIPPTNETECQRALREGRTWDASFSCPASTFIGAIFNRN